MASLLVSHAARSAAPTAGEPRSSEIVRRASAYVERYFVELTTFVAEERAHQKLSARPAKKGTAAAAPVPQRRTWRADFGTVRADDGAMLGFREILEVDGASIENSGAMRDELFGAGHDRMATARRIAEQASARNLGRLRTFNTPVATLELLRPDRAERCRVKARALDGGTWRIEVDERERPTLMRPRLVRPCSRGPRSSPMARLAWSRGSRWSSTIAIQSVLTCRFDRDQATGLLLPSVLEESFEERDTVFTGTFVYTNWRRFGTSYAHRQARRCMRCGGQGRGGARDRDAANGLRAGALGPHQLIELRELGAFALRIGGTAGFRVGTCQREVRLRAARRELHAALELADSAIGVVQFDERLSESEPGGELFRLEPHGFLGKRTCGGRLAASNQLEGDLQAAPGRASARWRSPA